MSEVTTTTEVQDPENSLVCYCYRLTTGDLKREHQKYGSLKEVERHTRAGTACTGCKPLLHSLFGEPASDHYEKEYSTTHGTTCQKPGSRTQKGFIIADGELESLVYSANATAPQLGSCDSTATVDILIVDYRGCPVYSSQVVVGNNKTFSLSTRDIPLPRPFFGQLFLTYSRQNYGGARFNIYWTNGRSYTSTHENAGTGRSRMFLPIVVDESFLKGPNCIHVAIMNPHCRPIPFLIRAVGVEDPSKVVEWESSLDPYCTTWMNANEKVYAQFLAKYPSTPCVLNVISKEQDLYKCVSVYFFVYNSIARIWNGNHL